METAQIEPIDESAAPVHHKSNWRGFFVVSGMLMVAQLGFYFTAAALPLYLRDLGAAQSRIGFEVGLGSIAGLVLTVVVGPALNRYGAVRFLRIGALLYVLAATGMLLVANELSVALLRAIQGVGTALLLPSAYTLGAELVPARRGAALGVMGSLTNLSLAAGPPIGLALYAAHGAAWLFPPAIATAALGLASAMLLRQPVVDRSAARGFGFDRIWLPGLLVNMLSAVYFGGVLAYLPLYLSQIHGPNAGIFFTADAIGVLLLRVPTGMLVDRGGSQLPKLIGIGVTLVGIAVLALPPSIFMLAAGGGLTGIGAGMIITGVMTDLSNLSTATNRGTAMSLGGGSLSAAFFFGGAVSGLLIGPGGFDAVLVLGAVSCVAALPFVAIGSHPKAPA